MIRSILCTGLVLLVLVWMAPAAAGQVGQQNAAPAETEEAQEVAEDWLALIDAGEYTESWQEAGNMMQEAVTQEEWEQQGEMMEQQLGDVTSREVAGAEYTEDLPEAPEGEYTLVQYSTMFGEMPVMEIVVLTTEEDQWKVVGYQIQPAQGAPQGQ